ncbi:MAG: hypothetical protein ACT6FF_10195 [Methanosarcinaceae archaeon]
MNTVGLVWISVAYGIYISILISLYFVYSKFLLNCVSANFGKSLDFKLFLLKLFFPFAAVVTIFSYFFEPIGSSLAPILSLTYSTMIVFYSDYSEVQVQNLLKLKLLLWIFHVVPLYLILLFSGLPFNIFYDFAEGNL